MDCLKQPGHLHRTLSAMGFTRLQSDPQLYIRKLQDDDFVIISTYVDRKYKDIADNLTFSIVGLAYNPDFKAKYFLRASMNPKS